MIHSSYDVRFIAITDGVDSANGINEMSGIRNLFNDMYAHDTSKKVRAVQKAKGERGERVGTTIPYGYMKVVLKSLRKVTAFAREHSDEFYSMAMSNGELKAKEQLKESENLRNEYEARITQLESAISMLYMDRVTGRVTPERYDILAADYETEQSELKSKLAELDSQLDNMHLREKCISDFINKAKQHLYMPKLTPELLRTFIRRIEIYEKPEKYSRTCGNHIIIYFTFQPDKAIRIDGAMTELDTTAFAE